MIQITPHMRVLVAVEPVDLRKGIDGLAAVCREKLQADPFSGWLFIFRSRRATAIRVLVSTASSCVPAARRKPSHSSHILLSYCEYSSNRIL
jgi:transposase